MTNQGAGQAQQWHYVRVLIGSGFKVFKGQHPAFGFTVPTLADAKLVTKELNSAQAALKAATKQGEHWTQAHREERVLREAATERAEVTERELRDCDTARTLVLSENERLANELMAMRAGRKAELEALRAKATLADEAYKETIAVEEANTHLPSSFRAAAIRDNMMRWCTRYDVLATPAPAVSKNYYIPGDDPLREPGITAPAVTEAALNADKAFTDYEAVTEQRAEDQL